MKGRSLSDLAKELERIQASAKDYVVPVQKMEMNPDGQIEFTNGSDHAFKLNSWSAGQVASYTDIPKSYFDRLRGERPDLLSLNVNHGLEKISRETAAKPESRMIRTLDGQVRAFLSSRYRRLDGYDLLNETLPIMLDHGFRPLESELTEKRVYVKAVTDRIQADVKPGDTVQFGLLISSSDVGAGSLRVEPFLNRLVCANGMVAAHTIRKFHIGKDQASREIEELLSDETKEMEDAAFWAMCRDVVKNSMRPDIFKEQVDRLRVAAGEEIKNFDLPRVVELTMKAVKVDGEKTHNNILAALASGNQGAGLTRWGLINAFTAAAKDPGLDYDSTVELERAGGAILNLEGSQWKAISASTA